MPKVIEPKALGAPLGLYSHGMVASGGAVIVVAGQVGVGPSGAAAADIEAQTRQAFENVRLVLEAAGAGFRDVVRFQTFLTRADDIPGFIRAREVVYADAYPDGGYPPNTLLVISRLVRPELLVEIEAMAVRPAGGGAAGRARAPKRQAAPRRSPAARGKRRS